MRQACLLVIVLALTACSLSRAPDEFGRVPVAVRVVENLPALGGIEMAARVVSPHVIEVKRGWERDAITIAHELVHVLQWHRVGFDFPLLYALQVITHGYWMAPLEVEARELAGDEFYLAWAREVIEGGAQ